MSRIPAYAIVSGVACMPAGPMFAASINADLTGTAVITIGCFLWGLGYVLLVNGIWGAEQ